MDKSNYKTTETKTVSYVVFGFEEENNKKLFVTANGYNPYEWRYEGYYSNDAVHFKNLKDAQSEADHAPEQVKNVTIEKIDIHKIIQTKVEKEIIEYEPKGLEPIICF